MKAAYKLNQIIAKHGLTLAAQNRNWLHLNDKIQLEVSNKIVEQVNSVNFLENMTSCEKEVEIDKKLNNYLNTTGISNNMLRQHKPLMKTRIKLHNTLTLTALLYGSKN